jgi:RNA polymerase sigma-70 factor (ECF subfamily)
MYALAEPLTEPTETFEVIYRTHHRRVLGLCRHLLNSFEAAEDAAHEVFLRAQARFGSYNPSLPVSSWLLGIASNYCIDTLRRRTTERRLFRLDPGETYDPPSAGPGPLVQVLAAEQARDVQAALAQLADKYRIPLVLAYYNEFSYDEIGAVLGIERGRVATLIFRGKQQLREKLQKEKRRAMSR